MKSLLPYPEVDANKYSRGVVNACVGSESYPGAACLAAAAAQRMGAGYVRVFSEAATVAAIRAFRPSLVALSEEKMADELAKQPREGHPAAWLVGSGFDAQDPRSEKLTAAVLTAPAPVVVDGGALSVLGGLDFRQQLVARAEAGLATVLTPHLGEALRLAKAVRVEFDEEDMVAFAMDLADAYQATIILKGPDTFIASPDDEGAFVMVEGTPALAKAGTGDVLAGIMAALMAQGLDAEDAAYLGTTLHARAGIFASMDLTEICVTPEDLLVYLPDAIRSLHMPGDEDECGCGHGHGAAHTHDHGHEHDDCSCGCGCE